ncbi:prostaglandin E synthase [Dasypus novemcinctus]|uniref:prostaglandin E synthase n=1 Tax=Dasypus novemcinctus TaxID=9361 RepID=UPI00062ABA8A|nr:prostaglandin E synthase [Dasypus novemcinctus]
MKSQASFGRVQSPLASAQETAFSVLRDAHTHSLAAPAEPAFSPTLPAMLPSGLEKVSGQPLPAFLLCSTLLVIKMYAVAVITGQVRLRKKAFANPEDAMRHGGLMYCRSDPDVERCLRAHRNDMETIYPFLFLGLVYSFLGPDPFVAQMHFLVVFVGRILHTVAYLGKLPAPTRSLAYTLAQLPCASMALQILWETVRHL